MSAVMLSRKVGGAVKQTQGAILACMVIAVGTTAIGNLTNSIESKAPAVRTMIGGWAVTVGLLLTAEWSPEIAEAFAVLILMATLLGPNGEYLVKLLTKLVHQSSTTTDSIVVDGERHPI